ncbi:MAG TPA: hypothetical protein VHZ51_29950, partial [Ktedonobacteraceae bacterium]|nr:hypothetical protein [Ktedonobacteraceae bacterium]
MGSTRVEHSEREFSHHSLLLDYLIERAIEGNQSAMNDHEIPSFDHSLLIGSVFFRLSCGGI